MSRVGRTACTVRRAGAGNGTQQHHRAAILTGVYFDHPDLTPQAQLGAYTPHQAPASQQELAYANAHPGSPLKLS